MREVSKGRLLAFGRISRWWSGDKLGLICFGSILKGQWQGASRERERVGIQGREDN